MIAGIRSDDAGLGSAFVEGFEEVAEMSTETMVGMAFGSLCFCVVTLVMGILAFTTKHPIIVGLITTVSSILGLILGGFFALALFISVIGGILICFGKAKPVDEEKK